MKKFLSSILAMLVVSLSLPHVAWAAAAEPITGFCGVSTDNGENVEYKITDEDKDGMLDKLTFKLADGVTSAEMEDFIYYTECPWESDKYTITTVEIQDGITNIGSYAFSIFSQLTSVTIPNSVKEIGESAFSGCSSLISITIPSNVEEIGKSAFYDCNRLIYVTIPASVVTIGYGAFYYCQSLKNVSYLGLDDLHNTSAGANVDIFSVSTPTDLKVKVPCNYRDEKFFNKTVSKEIHYIAETTTEPTCTETGTQTKRCKRTGCDYSETQTIPALRHKYAVRPFASNELSLGGTMYKCANCGDEYWTDFTKDDAYAQTRMPNGETIYHYCTHNGLAAETTVDVGDGQTLKVFLQDPLRVLKKNDTEDLDIVVTYIKEGSARYNELMSQVDGDHPIEHIKFFNVYPTVDGVPKTGALKGSIYMEYEIPEGWDEEDLDMILVQDGDDQEFDETVLAIDGKRYLATWKNHFSPYAMIDKLSEEEQAALNVDKLNDEQKAQLNTAIGNLSEEELAKLKEEIAAQLNKAEEKSSENQAKTGDEAGYIVLMSSALFIIAGLYLGLCMKKKRN